MSTQNQNQEHEKFLSVIAFAMLVCLLIGLSVSYLLPLVSTFSGALQVFLTYVSVTIIKEVAIYIWKGLKEVSKRI